MTDDTADGVCPPEGLSSRHIQVSCDSPQNAPGTCCLGGIQALFVDTKAPGDHCRPARGIHAGGLHDLLRCQPGYLRHPLGCIFGHCPLEIFKTDGPVGNKVLIIEILFNNQPEPAQHQGYISTRTYGEPDVRHLRLPNSARVHHDERDPVFLGHGNGTKESRIRLGRTGPPDNQAPCLAYVSPGKAAVGGIFHCLARTHTDVVCTTNIGGSKEVEEPAFVPVDGALGTMGKGEGLCPVLIPQVRQFPCHFIQGMVPAHLFPLPAPPLTCPLEGVIDPVRMIEVVDHQAPPAAQHAPGDGVLFVAFDAHGLTVFQFQHKAASWMAQSAIGPSGLGHGNSLGLNLEIR